jgi:hypothetical protein
MIPADVCEIGKKCFSYCRSLCEVTFETGSKLQRIERSAFYGNGLKKITIPSSVELIGESGFFSCKSLCEITFEAGSRLKEIGDGAFSGTSLPKIEIPSKCEVLTSTSLRGVKSVTISRENPFLAIEGSMIVSPDRKRLIRYKYSGRKCRVFIKKEIEVIGKECFSYCGWFCEVIFETGSRLQRIEQSAFYKTYLGKMTIPSSVEVIGKECFSQCESLCEVIFEPGSRLQRIGRYAFFRAGLKKIIIPSSVELIGECGFCSCESLCEVTFETGSRLQEIERWAFSGTNLPKIEIPSKCQVLTGLSLKDVKSVTISRENPFFAIEGSMIVSQDRKRLIRYFGCESQVLVKKEIEVIGEECFRECESLRKVTFERGSRLQRIGQSAFGGTALKKLTIPPSVEVIGKYCFGFCESLCEVTFEGSVREMAERIFDQCPLELVRVPVGEVLDVNLPEGCEIEYFDVK